MDWYKKEMVIWNFFEQWNLEKEVLNHVCKLLARQVNRHTCTTISFICSVWNLLMIFTFIRLCIRL